MTINKRLFDRVIDFLATFGQKRTLSKETFKVIEKGKQEVEEGKGLSLKQVKEKLDD